MNLDELIRKRRAVKAYDPEHELSEEELTELVTAAALAPTSFNMQNRHFVAVVDKGIKEKLMAAAWGQQQVRDASLVMVLTGDLDAYKTTDRYLRNAPDGAKEELKGMIMNTYEGNAAMQRDEACRSVGMSAMNLMLKAVDMGYDSGPMIGFDPAQVADVLGLDDDHPPLMIVVVGKGIQPAHPRLGLLDLDEVSSTDRFGYATLSGEIDA